MLAALLSAEHEPIIAAQTAIRGHSFVKVVKIIMCYKLMGGLLAY